MYLSRILFLLIGAGWLWGAYSLFESSQELSQSLPGLPVSLPGSVYTPGILVCVGFAIFSFALAELCAFLGRTADNTEAIVEQLEEQNRWLRRLVDVPAAALLDTAQDEGQEAAAPLPPRSRRRK